MKKTIGVILGGSSPEKHTSVDSGRNIYEKLASSFLYKPIAIFLTGGADNLRFFVVPINILLKDNADDIHEYLNKDLNNYTNDSLERLRSNAYSITSKYGETISQPYEVLLKDLPSIIDFAFIALHGHPGEDGTLQTLLEKVKLPYNGSGVEASALAMNKYRTNNILKKNKISVAKQILIQEDTWQLDCDSILVDIDFNIKYPLIVKPVSDGCSFGVKRIKDKQSLIQYANQTFIDYKYLKSRDFLVEELLCKGNAKHFMEISCGLLTHYDTNEQLLYEVFPPSETIAQGEILTLEEKFLAGEGQNITPAKFDHDELNSTMIRDKVKNEIKKVATILGLEGYARIDAFVKIYDDNQIEIYIIEANSLPGMTPATCIFHQCILHNYKPIEFIFNIIDFGFHKFSKI